MLQQRQLPTELLKSRKQQRAEHAELSREQDKALQKGPQGRDDGCSPWGMRPTLVFMKMGEAKGPKDLGAAPVLTCKGWRRESSKTSRAHPLKAELGQRLKQQGRVLGDL